VLVKVQVIKVVFEFKLLKYIDPSYYIELMLVNEQLTKLNFVLKFLIYMDPPAN
jgi:hypothetical protein